MKTISFLCFCICVGIVIPGCDEGPPTPPDPRWIKKDDGIVGPDTKEAAPQRFKASTHGYFFGGFNENRREIFIVTDTKTGREYLSITGCGVTELHPERIGKTTVQKEE